MKWLETDGSHPRVLYELLRWSLGCCSGVEMRVEEQETKIASRVCSFPRRWLAQLDLFRNCFKPNMQSRLSSLRLPALRTFQSRPLSTSPPAAFPIPSSSRFSEASPQAAASPPLSEGEQALKDKLATNMEGAKIEVQDVSGALSFGQGRSVELIALSSTRRLRHLLRHFDISFLLQGLVNDQATSAGERGAEGRDQGDARDAGTSARTPAC